MHKLIAVIAACLFATAALAQDRAPAGILILGDSNAEGPFGLTLYQAMRALNDPVSGRPLAVSIYAKCGAGANDWTSREYAKLDCGAWACSDGHALSDCPHFRDGSIPPLPELYESLGAGRRVTLVALGLNMVFGNRTEKLRDARRLIDAIHANGSACIWIGPPQAGSLFVDIDRFDRFVAALRETVTDADCRFIASDQMTDRRNLEPKDDHYGRDDAREWARRVIEDVLHPTSGTPLMALFR
ncbi:MAG: hypothetical protein JSR60_11790 [Proteobacteria bacterium]|nr:hypothetical protein [Pseudomonadota bacterium]